MMFRDHPNGAPLIVLFKGCLFSQMLVTSDGRDTTRSIIIPFVAQVTVNEAGKTDMVMVPGLFFF